MRIAWERVATVLLSVGLWALLFGYGRHALHLARSEVHILANLALRGRGRLA